jgi:hypothetical protein
MLHLSIILTLNQLYAFLRKILIFRNSETVPLVACVIRESIQ